jgi:hypothetical protein
MYEEGRRTASGAVANPTSLLAGAVAIICTNLYIIHTFLLRYTFGIDA